MALWLKESALAPAYYLALVCVIAIVLAPFLRRRETAR
jgi:hypothetical protein